MAIHLKRVYDSPAPEEGKRILVDRLWPRGMTKEKARVDLWLKDIAPTTELRQWFGHDPEKWSEFKKRYTVELKNNPALGELKKLAHEAEGNITIVYAARDEQHNEAVVIQQMLSHK